MPFSKKSALSRQEEKVLLLARQGMADKQIAAELSLSADTVRTYWQRIRQKVGGQTRAEIIAMLSDQKTAAALEAVHTERDVLLQEILKRKSIDKALRQSEQEWRNLAEAMPQVVFVSRADGQIIYFNGRFYEYSGVSRKEPMGEIWQAVTHPDDQPKVVAEMQRCVSAGIPFEMELRVRRHDGQYRWHVNRAIPLRNEQGRVFRWIGTSTDIHEIIELRNSLSQTTSELERAQVIAKFGSYEYDPLTDKGRASKNMFAIYGLEPVEGWFDGSMILDLFTPEDFNRIRVAIEQAIATEGRLDETYSIRKKDGGLTYLHSVADFYRNPEGFPRLVGTSQDITELTEAARRTEDIQRSLESAERVAKLGSFDWHIDTDNSYWSPYMKQLFELEDGNERMDPDSFFQHLHPADHEQFQQAMTQSLETGEPFDMEYRLVLSGKVRWIHALGSTEMRDGKVVRMIGTCQDITERKARDLELDRSHLLLRHLERNARMGSIHINLDDDTISWSDNLYVIHERDPKLGPLRPEQCRELLHPDDQDPYDRSIKECFEMAKPSTVEIRCRVAKDRWKWLRVVAEPMTGEDKIRRVLVSVTELDKPFSG